MTPHLAIIVLTLDDIAIIAFLAFCGVVAAVKAIRERFRK